MALRIKGLKIKYNVFSFGPFSLTAKKGITVVLGPNGAGKTTLLNMIAGLEEPDSGTITLDGRALDHVPVEKRRVGYVFQKDTLFPHLNVEQNVRFGLDAKRGGKDRSVKRTMRLLGIAKLGTRRVQDLSGGERQRVSIARTLVTDPDMLMLDEPLSNLDRPFRVKLRRELREILTDLGKVVIYVTHYRNDVHYLADRLAIIEAGRIVQVGDPDEILNIPRSVFAARFSGFHNILEGKVLSFEDGLVTVDVEGIKVSAVSETECSGLTSVCIKPEDVFVSKEPVVGSPRNSLRGKVVDVVDKGPLSEVLIENEKGIELRALITKKSAEDLSIKKGAELYATFKTVSARILEK